VARAAQSSVGLGRVSGGGGRPWGFGLGELRVVDGNVGFDLSGGDFLDLVGINGGGFDEEGILQPVDFTKIAEVSFPRELLVAYLANAPPFHDQAGGSVEVKVADVALFGGEFQFLHDFAVDLFLACVFELIAFGFVVDEGTFKVSFFGDAGDILRRHRSNGSIRRERVVDPAGGFAVVDADEALAADGDFHVHLEGALALDEEWAFDARGEGDDAGDALGLDCFEFCEAATGFDVGVDDIVGSLGGKRHWKAEKKRYRG